MDCASVKIQDRRVSLIRIVGDRETCQVAINMTRQGPLVVDTDGYAVAVRNAPNLTLPPSEANEQSVVYVRQLGVGSSAWVFEAALGPMRTRVAVKRFRQFDDVDRRDYAAAERSNAEFLFREVKVDPSNLVSYSGWIPDDRSSGGCSLLFELMDSSLEQEINRRRSLERPMFFTLSEFQMLAVQLVSAIGCLHSVKFAHADIHARNVMISGDVLKLADYGGICQLDDQTRMHGDSIAVMWSCFNRRPWFCFQMSYSSAEFCITWPHSNHHHCEMPTASLELPRHLQPLSPVIELALHGGALDMVKHAIATIEPAVPTPAVPHAPKQQCAAARTAVASVLVCSAAAIGAWLAVQFGKPLFFATLLNVAHCSGTVAAATLTTAGLLGTILIYTMAVTFFAPFAMRFVSGRSAGITILRIDLLQVSMPYVDQPQRQWTSTSLQLQVIMASVLHTHP
jgi:hypothetical protein